MVRNRQRYEQGQALREEIRAMLLKHPPCAHPLTAKKILRHIKRTPTPALRTVGWHLGEIRKAATAAR